LQLNISYHIISYHIISYHNTATTTRNRRSWTFL